MPNLCVTCQHRFRKVFIDSEVSEDTMIGTVCLITDWDIGSEMVFECSHFKTMNSNASIDFSNKIRGIAYNE